VGAAGAGAAEAAGFGAADVGAGLAAGASGEGFGVAATTGVDGGAAGSALACCPSPLGAPASVADFGVA